MIQELQIPLIDLITCLSGTMDLISPSIVDHHRRVAYIAFSIGTELDLSMESRKELVMAGSLHDTGAISLKERLEALLFEVENPYEHAELGYSHLKMFPPLANAADLVRFHHVPWNEGKGAEFEGKPVPMGSHILHLADRVAVLIPQQQEVLGQARTIGERIEEQSGKMFMPRVVEAFQGLAAREYFWLDAASPSVCPTLCHGVRLNTIEVGMEGLLGLASLFRRIIDFKSHFTATHSSGVAASAEALARLSMFSKRECQMMRVAGYLHDLGKLAVPTEVLEKPARLSEGEFAFIRSHTFYAYRTLESIKDLEVINAWASFHHERLDGSGYPFHLKGEDISLGSRIMAVADVFTAITEDRPYREGMSSSNALQILQRMADDRALDADIVSLLRLHFEEVNSIRIAAQLASDEEYHQFLHPRMEEIPIR